MTLSEQILITLSKIWKPLLAVVTSIVALLFAFYKGRSRAKLEFKAKQAEAEVVTLRKIIDEKKQVEKKQNEREKIYKTVGDRIGDNFTS